MVAQVTRRAPAQEVALDPAVDVVTRSELEEQLAQLRAVLGQVDEVYLDVLMLFTGPQLTYDEIAPRPGHPRGHGPLPDVPRPGATPGTDGRPRAIPRR